ncbi:MAG TPA: efflux RND transporter periplasmic adaptor subunit [Burkholderiaceae bacterium]|jgi:RND family efflux transporter MFP subunit|nr:efflux RND transporter periplasmic adaptor subunit [Burkholderiaceae bacterium]
MPEQPSSRTQRARPSRLKMLATGALVLGVGLFAWTVVSRGMARGALAQRTIAAATPTVATIKPQHGPADQELVLPGTVQAYYEAPIYARTSGYLKIWYTDIGAHVTRGQLLAEIDTPEVDHELGQSLADLATAQANYELAKSTNVRWQGLLATESVSKQDADQKASDEAAKKAAVASSAANVGRLQDLESFKRVTAPFDGVVTARNTDIGALINAGQNSGAALFRMADTRRLRIYAQVPQPYAAAATPGVVAQLQFAERQGKSYPTQVVRTAQALDPVARTLQVELQVDNSNGELFPGSYAEVHFKLAGNADSLRLPINALLFRSAGLQVAVVGPGHAIQLKNITSGRDFGKSLEVLGGLDPSDQVVLNPPDSITEGAVVRIAGEPEEKVAAEPAPPVRRDSGS